MLAASIACPALAQTTTAPTDVASKPMRAIGPLATKEMLETLATEYSKVNGTKLDYRRMDSATNSASGLLSGQELALCFGQVNDYSLGANKARWNALRPEMHILGARCIAMVVHPRNPIESLSFDQLQAIYSGKINNWKALGGEDKPIRLYGLELSDPLTKLFRDKTRITTNNVPYTRKKDSDAIAQSLATDPQGIGFMDVVIASTQGQTLRMVPISGGNAGGGGNGDAVWPNAQTIRDGSYRLQEPLVLYISPNASENAKAFAKFVISDQADAICRKYGFLPAIQPMTDQAAMLFERLYGADIKRATASERPDDAIALASQILASVRTTRLDPAMISVMCETAYTLAGKSFTGRFVALEAVELLWRKVPEKRFDAAVKWAALYERAYNADETRLNAEHAVVVLMLAADIGTSSGQYVESEKLWKKAEDLAKKFKISQTENLAARMPAFIARTKSVAQRDSILSKYQTDPSNMDLRRQLLSIELIELDAPSKAATYLDSASDEMLKTNLPLASMKVSEVAEDTAARLGEWYLGLAEQAGLGGRELCLKRARSYYLRFFELHKSRTDTAAIRCELGLKKAGGTMPPDSTAASTNKLPTSASDTPDFPPLFRIRQPNSEPAITDLRLAEWVLADPTMADLSKEKLGNPQYLTDLSPLSRLKKLQYLNLNGGSQVHDITLLNQFPELTLLGLRNTPQESLAPIANLSKLYLLDLGGSPKLKDITPVSGLSHLHDLTFIDCPNLTDLRPLSKLINLPNLILAQCDNLEDISPLGKMTNLCILNLSGCKKIASLKPLYTLARLQTLDLRGCDNLPASEIDALAAQLPSCQITRPKSP
ncbi:MAG: substrate-binding domain-containing protein [Phycisphaerales bacterium]|nr:substrate-binding domain-containing protein [Phycisphaerales bacterium]